MNFLSRSEGSLLLAWLTVILEENNTAWRMVDRASNHYTSRKLGCVVNRASNRYTSRKS